MSNYGPALRPKRPTKSQEGALDELLERVPSDAEMLAALSSGAMATALRAMRAEAWGKLKERDYETWNGRLVLAMWRAQGVIE